MRFKTTPGGMLGMLAIVAVVVFVAVVATLYAITNDWTTAWTAGIAVGSFLSLLAFLATALFAKAQVDVVRESATKQIRALAEANSAQIAAARSLNRITLTAQILQADWLLRAIQKLSDLIAARNNSLEQTRVFIENQGLAATGGLPRRRKDWIPTSRA